MIKPIYLGNQPYLATWEKMKDFTVRRTAETMDELWLLEHPSVYTQGQAGKAEHILNRNSIPIVQSDRGGQVTYHGPGQLVAYVLMDIKRRNLGIKTLVGLLEKVLIATLNEYGVPSVVRCGAPGVYIEDKKIASIGLRVKNGCTYHGIALNVDMDLAPFNAINPCGYSQLKMTQLSDFVDNITIPEVADRFTKTFLQQFGD